MPAGSVSEKRGLRPPNHGVSLLCRLLDDPDLLVGQAVKLVDQVVNLPVRGIDLALNGRLVRPRLPGLKGLVRGLDPVVT